MAGVETREVTGVRGGTVTMEHCCWLQPTIAPCHHTAVGRSSSPATGVQHHTSIATVGSSHQLTGVLTARGELTGAE